jgi:hypothetical protein
MTEQALEAMTRAEQDAKRYGYSDWARDRLRLIARDRATLERHRARTEHDGDYRKAGEFCSSCLGAERRWPCPDAQAVIDYWLGGPCLCGHDGMAAEWHLAPCPLREETR